MSAGEEDTELRDLVAQTLETKGVLGKIRVRKPKARGSFRGKLSIFQAQLRSQVFLALEEQESTEVRAFGLDENAIEARCIDSEPQSLDQRRTSLVHEHPARYSRS